MGFKSVLKKVGKVALKVAPYAAMAIPGVGIPLGMAISGAANAASKKLEGGSWKGALLAGGLGAGSAGIGGGALGSIGPSSSVLSKLGAGAAGKAVGTGATGKIGSVLGSMGMSALGNKTGQGLSNYNDISGAAPAGLSALGSTMSNRTPDRNTPSSSAGSAVPRSNTGNAPGFQFGSNNPNLADSIAAGRGMAVKNQQFRKGYDVYGQAPEATDEVPNPQKPVLSRMPRIYSDVDKGNLYGRNRRPRVA